MQRGSWIIGPESVRMLQLGHPWIIADAYTKRWPTGRAGDLVDLTDGSGRFLATALLDPGERIVARVLGREKLCLDRSWLGSRLERAFALRSRHCRLEDTDAYRLVNGEGDGIPGFTLDRYNDYLLMQLYTVAWQRYLPLLGETLKEMLAPAGIYWKLRPQQTRGVEGDGDTKKFGRLLVGSAAPDPLQVREYGLNFLVSLERGLNTGLFLDQRINRRNLIDRVKGKRVLNLFSYTGSFSVVAAAGGARRVTSVDASAAYTEQARANFGANRLNPKQHDFIVGDCLSVLADMERQGKRFDMVIIDPPSFSTTSKSRFTTRGGTADLVAAALPLLEEGGLLITASNHQKVELADYLKELRRGALKVGSELRVIEIAGQPEDFPYPVTFPEGRYLKYVVAIKGSL